MAEPSAENLLFGKTLVWFACDPTGVATAMIHGVLRKLFGQQNVGTQLISVELPGEIAVQAEIPGFALWVLSDRGNLDAVVDAIVASRRRPADTICAVLVNSALCESTHVLLEAGAQLVVSQLTFLEHAVRHAAKCMPLSNRSSHPLTCNLAKLLPEL